MLEKYYPYGYAPSVFAIDYKKLYDKGFRGLVFDIDNTLVEMLGLNKSEVIYLGDQMFVDTVGANRCGLPNILVHFIRLPNEKKIGKKRYIEMLILWFYRRNKKYRDRLGDILKGDSEK